jgi:hypothetical protein
MVYLGVLETKMPSILIISFNLKLENPKCENLDYPS